MKPGVFVKTGQGLNLRLGQILGRGGEGTIFHVESDSALAVKIYTDGKQLERLPKLQAMIADKLFSRTSRVAFPLDTVHLNGAFIGFTMRKATTAKPVYSLCISADRKNEFPTANYRFLVRVALNYAKAVASIHDLGAIVGDINESGALVDQKGLVTMIDSDSFQYAALGKTFRCLVGKPEYTPPELHGQPLKDLNRTANHDAFGLAVIIFEILFLGRHPFSGVPRGLDHPTIGQAITTGRFAYSPHKSITNMDPPKHMPVLADIPVEVGTAFQNAFGPHIGGNPPSRPTAAEWVKLLEKMEKAVVECKVNPAHYHSISAKKCPWCTYEAGYATILFVHQQTATPTTFSLEQVLAKIEGISAPGPAPKLALLMPNLSPKPSQLAKASKFKSFQRKIIGTAFAVTFLILITNGIGLGIFLLIPAAMFFYGDPPGKSDIVARKVLTERNWQAAKEAWEKNVGSGCFDEKKSSLKHSAALYRALPGVEWDMLAALEKRKQDLQRQKFCEAQKIARATIEGIGESRKLTLRSFGIETAWDIKQRAILEIPGFGPSLTGKLMDWRNGVERRFQFNPATPTDPAEIAKVRNEIRLRRNTLETELLKGISELKTIKAEALARRQDARQHEAAYSALLEAKEDFEFIMK